jgi:hypothetical protein
MWNKVLKFLFGLSLIPFCAGFTWQLAEAVFSLAFKPLFPYYFVGGGLAYLTAHLLFRKPILTYVFGHELSHAFFAMLFGGSVKSFHASDRGGRVTITKSNFIITLAPYFFPFYTFMVLLAYWGATAAEVRGAAPWLVFFSGTTFTFHLVLTVTFLQVDQDDIREHGVIFSYPLIYLFNVLFASLLVRLQLAESMDYPKFLGDGIMKSIGMTILFVRTIGSLLFPGA